MGGRVIGLSAALPREPDAPRLRRCQGAAEGRAALRPAAAACRHRPTCCGSPWSIPRGAAGHADIAGDLARWERAGILAVTSIIAAFEGPRAAADLVAALRRAVSGDDALPDVMVLVRGGGDRTGLLSLDTEAVARAVCLCPVPIIAGLGHQVDSTLVDEVAAVSCHTPSKALAPPRRPHRRAGPARPGRHGGRDGRGGAARRRRRAPSRRSPARGRGGRRTPAGGGRGTPRGSAGELRGRCRRRGGALGRVPATSRRPACSGTSWSARRSASARPAARRSAWPGVAMAGSRRRLEGADDGRPSLAAAALTRAGARLDAAALDVARRREALPLDGARHLTDAGLDLGRLAALVESLGLDATLQRGFALATRIDGTLVPTRAAALAAACITLTFADGAVAAHVGVPLTATPITGEAA